jgi:hypothetical protein
MGSLPSNRQALAMPQAAVRSDFHQAFDVHRGILAQVTLDLEILKDNILYRGYFLFTERVGTPGSLNVGLKQNFFSCHAADTKYGRQSDTYRLMFWYIYTGDSRHFLLSFEMGLLKTTPVSVYVLDFHKLHAQRPYV